MTELLIIKKIIDEKYNVDISRKTRKNGNPDLLKIYSKIAKVKTAYSLTQIGNVINRDHASVITQIKKADIHIATEKLFRAKYDDIFSLVPDFSELSGITSNIIKNRIKSHLFEIRKLEKELKQRQKL